MFLAALPPPTPILIYAREYSFNGSRQFGRAGIWRINVRNIGEDEHDIWVLNRMTKKIVTRSRIFLPGQFGTVRVKLPPGTYTLYCGVANHRQLGMKWRIKVARQKRAQR